MESVSPSPSRDVVVVDLERLEQERRRRGLSLAELGRAAGLSPSTLAKIRARGTCSITVLRRLDEALRSFPVLLLADEAAEEVSA